jgi:hemerythrin-like domain-containing protein
MADSSIKHLLRDHREARGVLSELDSLLDAIVREQQWSPERSQAFRKISDFFLENLCCLIRKEDEILYPSLVGLFPTELGPLSVLRSEHKRLCAAFRELCEAGKSLAEGKSSPQALEDFERSGRSAAEVLRDHMYKEERVLFPMVARYLTPERDAELLQKMQSLQAARSPLPHPKRQE